MLPSKCDEEGNLYIRKYATDRLLLGPIAKIDTDGKRTVLFDAAAFSQLGLDRADEFTPAFDGGLYQIAQKGVVRPEIYVLHFSPDGSPSSSVRLDADFEVYTFAAFPSGNFLVSGMEREATNAKNRGSAFTAVFSADGRMLTQLSLEASAKGGRETGTSKSGPQLRTGQTTPLNVIDDAVPALDLSGADAGRDGNLYAMRASSPVLVYVISPSGNILRTLKVRGLEASIPSSFHVSGNQLAISFYDNQNKNQMIVIIDAQTGRRVAMYSDESGVAASFACFSADDEVFKFLKLGEGNALEVIRAQAQ